MSVSGAQCRTHCCHGPVTVQERLLTLSDIPQEWIAMRQRSSFRSTGAGRQCVARGKCSRTWISSPIPKPQRAAVTPGTHSCLKMQAGRLRYVSCKGVARLEHTGANGGAMRNTFKTRARMTRSADEQRKCLYHILFSQRGLFVPAELWGRTFLAFRGVSRNNTGQGGVS